MFEALRESGVVVVGWNRGMGSCCAAFEPWFTPRGLAGLPAVHEVPNSETHHVFETFRKNTRVSKPHATAWQNT